MKRFGRALLGGLLGAVLGGAAAQLLFRLCVFGWSDAESCGMGAYLLVGPALVLGGGCLGFVIGVRSNRANNSAS